MLAQRVVTAVVLLAILVPAIFLAPPWGWGLVSLALLTVAGFEWGRLVGSRASAWAMGLGLGAGGLLYLWARVSADAAHAPHWVVWLAGAGLSFWLLVAPRSLARVERIGPARAIGVLVLACCWIALYELRLHGSLMLVSCMAIIWLADIGAFFSGRRFGRRKLAPRVSPNKSWEGVVGGMALVLVAAALVGAAWPTHGVFSNWLGARAGGAGAAVLLLAIAALSVVGDLYESLLKRLAGVKDSGWVLPGHGGVLDRIDALIPTMPGCLLLLELLR